MLLLTVHFTSASGPGCREVLVTSHQLARNVVVGLIPPDRCTVTVLCLLGSGPLSPISFSLLVSLTLSQSCSLFQSIILWGFLSQSLSHFFWFFFSHTHAHSLVCSKSLSLSLSLSLSFTTPSSPLAPLPILQLIPSLLKHKYT